MMPLRGLCPGRAHGRRSVPTPRGSAGSGGGRESGLPSSHTACTGALQCNTVTEPIVLVATSSKHPRCCHPHTGCGWCSTTRHEPWQVTAHDAGSPCPGHSRVGEGAPLTVRLLTNIGRLWTGSEVWSNAAILTQGERIAWVGPAAELPRSMP